MRSAFDDEVEADLRRARARFRAAIADLLGIANSGDAIERSTDGSALSIERPRAAVAGYAHDDARLWRITPIEDKSSGRDGEVSSEGAMQ